MEDIDAQHRQLNERLSQIGKLVRTRCAKPIICQALSEFVELALEHFEDEERVMDLVRYPQLQAHREVHLEFIEDLRSYSREYSLTGELRATEMLEFMCNWTTIHLLVWDCDYLPYVNGTAPTDN